MSLLAPALAQDPLTKQALQRIEEVEKKEPALAPGDVKAANLLLNSLDQAGKRLNAVGDKTEAKWTEAQQRFADVRKKIETKAKAKAAPVATTVDAEKLAQLDKEIAAAHANFKLLSTKHLADPFRSQSTQKEIDGFTARVAEFPAADEAVAAVALHLREFRDAFAAAMARLQKDVGEGAAVARRLGELDAKYEARHLPAPIEPPFTEAQVVAWATGIRRWRDVEIPADAKFLGEAAGNAAVDQQHVDRLRNWLDEGFCRRLTEVAQSVQARIDGDAVESQRFAEFVLATDPADKDQVTNRVLGKGRFDENMARLRAGERAVAIARTLDRAMGRDEVPERTAQAATVEKAIDHFQGLAVLCLDAVRMPPAASADAGLLQIAAATLKDPAYGAGTAVRTVINAPRVRHERREGWIEVSATDTAKVTVYTYAWDQFQVTTAEKVGEETWMFANTLKRFDSGDPTTPIGRWILADRIQLTRILPDHVDK